MRELNEQKLKQLIYTNSNLRGYKITNECIDKNYIYFVDIFLSKTRITIRECDQYTTQYITYIECILDDDLTDEDLQEISLLFFKYIDYKKDNINK